MSLGPIVWLSSILVLLMPPAGCATAPARADTAPVAVTTLSVLKGQVGVQSLGADGFVAATTRRALTAGDRIRTASGGAALITFFDGSTTSLDTETEVTLYHQRSGGQRTGGASADVTIAIRQTAGATWSRTEPAAGSTIDFQVLLPAASAMVGDSGTLEVSVPATGPAVIRTIRGSALVKGDWGEQHLPAGWETVLPRGDVPGAPVETPLPYHRVALRLDEPGRAWLRVVDGLGRSAGVSGPGLAVDQLPGALISDPLAEPQHTVLTRLLPGRYTVLLETRTDGPFAVVIAVESEGKLLLEDVRRGTGKRGGVQIAPLEVQGQGGRVTGVILGVFTPPRETPPGVVVRTISALEAVARRSAPATTLIAAAHTDGAPTSSTRQIPTPTVTPVATSTVTQTPAPTPTPALPTATPPPAQPAPAPPSQPAPAAATATPVRTATAAPMLPTRTATPASPQGGRVAP